MRVGFVCWGMFAAKGGSERVCAKLAWELCQRGHECVVFCTGNKGEPVYPLPNTVKMFDLGRLTDQNSFFHARQCLQGAKIDVLCVLGLGPKARALPFLLKGSGIPWLASEHTAPARAEALWDRYERLAVMASAGNVHLLLDSYLTSLPEFLRERAIAISNPAPKLTPVHWEKENASRKCLLTVARLEEYPKQLSLLIRAVAALAEEFPDWDCLICGEGFSRAVYENLLKQLCLEGRVRLLGTIEDVGLYYAKAHLFCLPSVFEGFPVALLEAQSFGLPSVGFADCPGVNEVIVHNENGLLASDMTADVLASSLRQLMATPSLRRRMGERAQTLCRRYDEKKIFDNWEAMLQSIAQTRCNSFIDTELFLDDPIILKTLQQLYKDPRPGSFTPKNITPNARSALDGLRARHKQESHKE